MLFRRRVVVSRSCFCCVVTVTVGGKTVLELLDMPRPFGKLKALVMEDVAADVAKACA